MSKNDQWALWARLTKNVLKPCFKAACPHSQHNWGCGHGATTSSRKSSFIGVVSCVLDPPHCRRQVSAPCSTVREEAWGVGGLCKLAKGVYTEIQAWETNGHERKTFIHKQHHMLDFKAWGVSVHEKLSFLLHSKKNRWCHTRKSLWRNSILLNFWNLPLTTLVISKKSPDHAFW